MANNLNESIELENIQRSKKHTLDKKHSMNKTDVVQKNRYASLENYEGDDILRNHHEGVERTYEELLTKENNKSTKRNITILGDSLTKDSDHHKMVITVLKTFFTKLKPCIVKYRSYTNLDEDSFKSELNQSLHSSNKLNMNYDDFKQIFMRVLNRHAPMKEKTIRGNNAPFMNKSLSKSIMVRSKLKNSYNNFPTEENKGLYNKQRNYCTNLAKKVKKDYYNNLDLNIFKDNKTFWKNIRPLFSDKQKDLQHEFILIENGEVISDEQDIAEKRNDFFVDVTENLGI